MNVRLPPRFPWKPSPWKPGDVRRSAWRALPVLVALAATARADVPIDTPGRVETLQMPPGSHWVLAGDEVQRRAVILDLESGRTLGMIDGGAGMPIALVPRGRNEMYVPETHYSRTSRGQRTDVLTLYSTETLLPVGEVVIPTGRASNTLPCCNAALSDDEALVAVFNYTPATSLSIVDVARRVATSTIETPGCSLVYSAGPRRFMMLCADGALLTVELDELGRERSRQRSEPIFDPVKDPVTEKAVRHGDRWLFVSFEGIVHPIDVSGPAPAPLETWSLLDEADRAAGWRIGGPQHLALHDATGRLYSLVHQGGPDTHKEAGSELWVYDVATRKRVQRIEMRSPGLTYLGVPIGVGWPWPFSSIPDWVSASIPELSGIDLIAVTQDDHPLLVTGSAFSGSLAIYDALSGEFLRRVAPGNMTTFALQAPWSGEPARR